MDSLEGTPEFNRQHRLLNGAGLDPYIDQPIPNQQPLNVPRQPDEELYEHYIEEVVEPMQEEALDGQEYQPSPHLEPDTRTGFDSEGNYHVDIRPNIPFRIAEEIQQFVLSQTVLSDYDLSLDERHEIAYAYALHLIDQNAFTDEMVAFDALQLWRIQHGRSHG